MEDIVLIEWTFSPEDFFEEEIRIARDDYTMTIGRGKVEARVDPTLYAQGRELRDALHNHLNERFLGVQFLTHKEYSLSEASMCRFHSDGRKDVTIFPHSIVSKTTFGTIDLIVKDKDGNIVSDSRRDRIEKKKRFANLSARFASTVQVANSILRSYQAAVRDPDNELVHLYEIRDAVSKAFSGKKHACQTLGLSTTDWRRLGDLANDRPIKQGRHRGKCVGALRDATEQELEEARMIAQTFVEAYLVYLDATTN